MAIDPEVISPSSQKGRRAGRYSQKWALYSLGGVGVIILIGFIKSLLPAIGMAFLLSFIWSKAKITRRYWEICDLKIKVFLVQGPPELLPPYNEMVNRRYGSIKNVNN